jgi:GntR family transcriptional regulator
MLLDASPRMNSPANLPIKVRHDAQTPVYLQIMYQLSYLITSAQLKVGQQLPPVRDVARKLRVNTGTVARAYSNLRDQGLVESVPGSGTYVAPFAATAPDMAERRRLMALALRRAVNRARSLGFTEGEIRQSLEAELDVAQSGPTVLFAAPTKEVAHKYAASLERRLAGRIKVVAITFGELEQPSPLLVSALDLAYFIVTFARFVRSVENVMAESSLPCRVLGVGTVVQPKTITALQSLKPTDRLCLITSEPLVDMGLNLIAEHSVVPRPQVTVLTSDQVDESLDVVRAFERVLFSFSEGHLVEKYGVPAERRLELEFDVTEESLESLRALVTGE